MIHPNLSEIITELRDYLENLYTKQLVRLILYGSQARQDAHFYSDIDMLIVLKEPKNFIDEIEKISYFISALSLKYNVLISCNFVSENQYQNEQGGFFRNIRHEGIAL
ncbi:MAG: nucleotidyltransferase domain-containing protein [Lyngbya sp.]|nr:nucleotidyltransferase domain-containing protein [Lyngbya sp.]